MQEVMDTFIHKQSEGYVTNKRLWMTHRASKVKNKRYFNWNKIQESKLYADYVTYTKYQNRAVAEIRKIKKIISEKAIWEYKK